MSYGLNRFSTRTKLMAGALALIMAGASHAATQVGGGATLPSIGYVGPNAATMLQVTGSNIDSGSLFGVYASQSGNAVAYCLTGSGAGKNILAGASGFNVQLDCVKDTGGTVHGFGAATVGRTDLTQPNFAGADAPLGLSDYNNYVNNHPSGYFPTQFPAVAGAVAIAMNLTDDQGTPVTAANFTDAQLCSIFSGAISTWDDPALNGAFSLPSGHTATSAIRVVYRSDGSGTTFSFANHLANVCSHTPSAHFVTDQAFTTVVSKYQSTIPSSWVGASGNPAVANAIQGTAGSIGYVETANALQTNPAIVIADVNGKSPTADFQSNLTITAAALAFNSVINGADPNTGVATVSSLSSLGVTPPSTQCMAIVQPADYAIPGSSGSIVSATSYPIVAVSYLMGNSDGNGTDLAAARGLLTAPYTSTITSQVTTVGHTTGLQFLTLGRGSFTSAQVGACLAN